MSRESVQTQGHTSVYCLLCRIGTRRTVATVKDTSPHLRALCVARHIFIAEHLTRFFATLGIETRAAVGLEQAAECSRNFNPDVVISEYELLSTLSLEAWERDQLLSRCPVIAVSLTLKPQASQLSDGTGFGGFLYLPSLHPEAAMRLISAAGASSRNRYIPPLPDASRAEPIEN